MFFQYALDPEVICNRERARYFLDAFGPWKGRFIACYPKTWKKRVYDSLKCEGVEKKYIEERLVRLDRRVFAPRPDSTFNSSLTWLRNAIEENKREAFRAIIASSIEECAGDVSNVVDANAVDETNELWAVSQGRLVARNLAAVKDAISLLIRLSSQVLIIDPYFRPGHRHRRQMLQMLCALAGPSVVVEVHSRLGHQGDGTYDWFKGECLEGLSKCIPRESTVVLRTWQQRVGGARLHNRYLLTNIGGVQFGDGIELGDAGEQDHLSILDEASRQKLWEHFKGPAFAFDEVGEPFSVLGTTKVRML